RRPPQPGRLRRNRPPLRRGRGPPAPAPRCKAAWARERSDTPLRSSRAPPPRPRAPAQSPPGPSAAAPSRAPPPRPTPCPRPRAAQARGSPSLAADGRAVHGRHRSPRGSGRSAIDIAAAEILLIIAEVLEGALDEHGHSPRVAVHAHAGDNPARAAAGRIPE